MNESDSETDSPEEYFENCFVEPLSDLQKMKEGKGAVVALATSIFLYERYWSVLPEKERAASKTKQLVADFNVSDREAEIFWDIFRNGLLHLASPKQRDYGKSLLPYSMRPDVDQFLSIEKGAKEETLVVNPWIFTNRVVQLWKKRLDKIDSNKSAPIPKRYRIETYYYTDNPGHVEHRIVQEG